MAFTLQIELVDWQITDDGIPNTPDRRWPVEITNARVAYDGQIVMTCARPDDSKMIFVHELQDGKLQMRVYIEGPGGEAILDEPVINLCFHPDNRVESIN